MTDFRLDGQFGIVTGGTGPLGWSLVKSMSEAGASVLAVDLPQAIARAENEPKVPGVELMACDLLVSGHLDALVARVQDDHRGLNFLVNNAAHSAGAEMAGYVCAFEEQTDEAFDSALALNLAVPFKLAKRLTPSLRSSGNGSIVNIASIYGLVGPVWQLYSGTEMGNPAGYDASKGGLVQLTRYLATTLAPTVRVNCVCPGGIERGQAQNFIDRYEARTPLGRMASEKDVGGAVEWLVSGASAYVTGQVIAVDGGWTAW